MKINLVMPVHNEASYLEKTLPSLEGLPVDEIVILLDRCSDLSECVIMQQGLENCVIYEKDFSTWEHPIAEAWEYALSKCKGDIIFTTAADFLLDPSIFWRHEGDITSFSYGSIGANRIHDFYTNMLNRYLPFIYTCKYGKWSGHFSFKREVWERVHFRDVRSPDKDFINRCYDMGFSHCYKRSEGVHLRSGNDRLKQFEQGKYRREARVNPLKVWLHAFAELKPYLLKGYYTT